MYTYLGTGDRPIGPTRILSYRSWTTRRQPLTTTALSPSPFRPGTVGVLGISPPTALKSLVTFPTGVPLWCRSVSDRAKDIRHRHRYCYWRLRRRLQQMRNPLRQTNRIDRTITTWSAGRIHYGFRACELLCNAIAFR